MTNMTASDGDTRWGEARAAERASRKKRRRIALASISIGLMVGLPFALGVIDGVVGNPRSAPPRQIAYASAIAILIIGAFVTWRNWRETDEMQRQLTIRTWAVIGLTSFALHPIFAIVSDLLGRTEMQNDAWLGSTAIGIAFYLTRRVRS